MLIRSLTKETRSVVIEIPRQSLWNALTKELGRSSWVSHQKKDLQRYQGERNVRNVIIDLSKNYHKLARELFPNARIIADRFHVIQLFNNILNNNKKLATGDVRKNPINKLLLKKNLNLEPYVVRVLERWLDENPLVKEVYYFKESMHRFYQRKNFARKILIKITDQMALSKFLRSNLYDKHFTLGEKISCSSLKMA